MRTATAILFGLASHLALAATLSVVSPTDKAVVPLLSADQKAYLDMSRDERRAQFADFAARKRIAKFGDRPQKVTLDWRLSGTNGTARVRYAVRVTSEPDGALFWQGETEKTHVRLDNFEAGRTYAWKVTAKTAEGDASAGGTFATEDRVPRMIHLHGVPNMRDIGGRKGLNGRRVRQGRIYRSAGLNSNASKSKDGTMKPGRERLNDTARKVTKTLLGIRTDIDLRSSRECYGMTGSPLGPEVKWLHVSSSAYSGFHKKESKEAFAKVFRAFLDEANYPIVFHCIAGADRTGSLAFVLEALLGVDENELYADWEVTGFSKSKLEFRHETRFDKLVKGFDVYPGKTIQERVEEFVKSCGFTAADIARFRDLMLEPAATVHAVEGISPAVYYGAEHAVTSGDKTAELAVIVIHGWGGGAKGSDYKTLREDLAKRGVKAYVVAPLFPRRSALKKAKVADDGRAVWGASWDVPGERGGPADDWRGGGDAVGTAISSFDIVDRIMETLSDARLYPALKRVVLAGFSAGGQFTGRYVATGKCPLRKGLAADFAVIAPSTELRLDPDTTWHYGLKDRPRYSAKLTEADIRRNLASRRVWRGCGTEDVKRGALDESPPAMLQGKNRYDRFINFKEYLKGYPDWAAKVSFHDIPGVGHSGAVYRDDSFLDFIAGVQSK